MSHTTPFSQPFPPTTSAHSKTIDFTTFSSLFPPKPPPKPAFSSQKRLSSFFNPKPTNLNSIQLPFSRIPQIPPKNSGSIPMIPHSPETIKNWLFLTVKAIRKYQVEIVEISLFYNTLVCLPTGLGKTFIASLVILNYFLWFPTGKIFFLAPTRPLVHQQKQALYDLKSIPRKNIIEITGGITSEKRREHYKNIDKRIFFMTPQTLENDMKERRIDLTSIILIIFDEAHRATGDYAYCGIIKSMDQGGFAFRVLGLSASPGNNLDQVQEVIENLKINKLELREENDPDVKPYLFVKDVVPCVIKRNESIEGVTGKIEQMIMQYFKKITVVNEVMGDNFCYKIRELNRGFFMDIFDRFRKRTDLYVKYGKNYMGKMYELFSVISSLFYGKSLISTQGIQSFKLFLDKFASNLITKVGTENKSKQELINSSEFQGIKTLLSDICNNKTAHPKLAKLKELLTDYFNSIDTIKNNSKAIIFTQSRNTAQEISLFINENPRIISAIFIGQSGRFSTRKKAEKDGNVKATKNHKNLAFLDKYKEKEESQAKGQNHELKDILEIKEKEIHDKVQNKCPGMSQKEQIATIQAFKANKLNTLIATCIGEEGLDIGDVDLIICYDSGFSPIRMIQRKGRTGRHRDGKVIILLMEGKEMNSYMQNVKKSEGLIKSLKKCSMLFQDEKNRNKNKKELKFYPFSPRMVPEEENPVLMVKNALLQEGEDKEEDEEEEREGEMKKRKYTKRKIIGLEEKCEISEINEKENERENEKENEKEKEKEKENENKNENEKEEIIKKKRKYTRRKKENSEETKEKEEENEPEKKQEEDKEKKKRKNVKLRKKENDECITIHENKEKIDENNNQNNRDDENNDISLLNKGEIIEQFHKHKQGNENEEDDDAKTEGNISLINENTRATIDCDDELKNLKKIEDEILEMDPDNEEINFERMERELEKLLAFSNNKSFDFSSNPLIKAPSVINPMPSPLKNDNFTNKTPLFKDPSIEEINFPSKNDSFDSGIDKAIDDIVVNYENSQKKPCVFTEESDDFDLVDSLVKEFEKNDKKNDKKRKFPTTSSSLDIKKLKYEK